MAKALEVPTPVPRAVWLGLLRGCTPPRRRAAASLRAPAAPAEAGPARLVPCARGQPRDPYRKPPPTAWGSRCRRQASYRLPVQGRAAAACAKLRFPKAALAARRLPSRPRTSLRSPCRRAAISDKRLRNLPKCAGPEMAEPRRLRAMGGIRRFPDSVRRTTQASMEPLGSLAWARERRRRRRGLWETRRGRWEKDHASPSGPSAPRPISALALAENPGERMWRECSQVFWDGF